MPAAAVVRRALGHVAALRLDIDVDRLVVTGLRAAAPGPSSLLFTAACDAGHDDDEALERAAAAFLLFACFNLADDLSDGDCDYLATPAANAVVLILHDLAHAALHDLGLPAAAERAVLCDLLAAEAAQVLEVTTSSWTADLLRVVTDGIAGRQWAAYLRLLWGGTPMAARAADVARDCGRVGLLTGDITSRDPRYMGLSWSDRRVAVQQALEAAARLAEFPTRFTRAVVADVEPVLRRESAYMERRPGG